MLVFSLYVGSLRQRFKLLVVIIYLLGPQGHLWQKTHARTHTHMHTHTHAHTQENKKIDVGFYLDAV